MKHDTQATIFVRNLTKDTSKEELAQVFSDVGPVKHAIIVHERKGGPSKGFGFVTFALPADADEALTRSITVKGKPVKLERASEEKKPRETPAKKVNVQERVVEDDDASPAKSGLDETDDRNHSSPASGKKQDVVDWKTRKDERRRNILAEETLRSKTVVLFGVPSDFTEQQLRKRLKKHVGGVVQKVERDSDGCIRVVFDDVKHVAAAVKELSGRQWGESTVTARRGVHVFSSTEARSRCRLICRNLGFHVDDDALRSAFGAHGPLQEVVIKRDDEGKSKGFAFVQFYCKSDAQKAVNALNASSELGPKNSKAPIAVDFALAKDKYEALKQREPEVEEEAAEIKSLASSQDEEENDGEAVKSDEGQSDDGSDDENGDEDDDESDVSEAIEEDDIESSAQENSTSKADKGVQEGRTLFVSNLLFETDEAALRKRFAEYGPVRGVKLIKDGSGRSRGLGFVEFWQRESCDKVLGASEITLEGRAVFCKRAVDKSTAQTLKKQPEGAVDEALALKQKKLKADKRHMYLAQEGRVPLERVPQADRKKRQALEDEKRTKLRNPLFFVSPTRLSIKNLNRKEGETLDVKELKRLVKDAAITGVRARMVSETEGDRELFPAPGVRPAVRVVKATAFHEDAEDPGSRSAGFAFVELTHHVHALAALRVLNNNADYAWAAAGGKQAMKLSEDARPRLIVSFAIENASKVRAQKLRLEKSKVASSKPKPAARTEEAKDTVEPVATKPAEKQAKKQAKQERKPKKDDKAKPESKRSPKVRPRTSSEYEQPAPERKKRVKVEEKDISNRAFERKARKRTAQADQLDEIVAKRSNLFEEPTSTNSRKRWFEE